MPASSLPAFIAVDWGTTSFRAALITGDGSVVDELSQARGALSLQPSEFAPYLEQTCAHFVAKGGQSFLLSGMVGSKQGMLEAPYCPCPASAAHIAAHVVWAIKDRVAIVPGVRSAFDDVMRGEETQVLGAALALGVQDALVVLPGTHSKWVRLQAGAITGFDTFMTGEFYALLCTHSILAKSMPATPSNTLDQAAFLQGIDHTMHSPSLLNGAFSLRVKSLFGQLHSDQADSYLSGLVIGEELKSIHIKPGIETLIVGAQSLTERYAIALAHTDKPARTCGGTQAAWLGLHNIYVQLHKNG